jgi:hypothetical protein
MILSYASATDKSFVRAGRPWNHPPIDTGQTDESFTWRGIHRIPDIKRCRAGARAAATPSSLRSLRGLRALESNQLFQPRPAQQLLTHPLGRSLVRRVAVVDDPSRDDVREDK